MTRVVSPLRYPGGKTYLYALAAVILRENRLERGHYVEPYAGGGVSSSFPPVWRDVSDIHINDLDPSVWCFWDSVLNRTEQLVQLIQRTPVTIKEWHRQRDTRLRKTPLDPWSWALQRSF